MIEKHQILIDALSKIALISEFIKSIPEPESHTEVYRDWNDASKMHDIAGNALKMYMGAGHAEADECFFLPGYHEHITAHTYDVKHGYLSIEYSIPKNILKLPYAAILPQKYRYTHEVTSVCETESHLVIIIDAL